MNFFSLLFIITIYLLNKTSSKIIFDRINTNVNSLYLTKFSFHPIDGHIEIDLDALEKTVRFFFLSQQEWKDTKDDLPKFCFKKELLLIPVINKTNSWVFSSSFTSMGRMYFILNKCNITSNTSDSMMTYKVILTNGNNFFTENFSDDERGILELFLISTSLYTILLFVVIRYIYFLKTNSCLTMKFYLLSIFCSWLFNLISFIELLIFALTGNDETVIYRLLMFVARLFNLIAQILFLLVLLLCAKGYLILWIQLKKKVIVEIVLIFLIYINMEIIILIIITIFADRVFDNENVFMICGYIQLTMYLLTGLWFIISLLFTMKNSNKHFYFFFIFSIWFLTNAIVALFGIIDSLPNPQITIRTAIQIGVQYFVYCIFMFVIGKKSFFLQTKLNQINIAYIVPTLSKPYIEEPVKVQKANSCELTNLCLIENAWTSKFRIPFKSSGPLPRLEPRRDVMLKALPKSSIPIVPCRLIPLNYHDQCKKS